MLKKSLFLLPIVLCNCLGADQEPAKTAEPTQSPSQIGKYQIAIAPNDSNGHYIYFLDTETGTLWSRYCTIYGTYHDWIAIYSPLE